MPSQGSDASAGQGGATDGPDPESSRSSFFPCNNDDEDDGWDALDAIFTQHEQGLSQSQGNDGERGDDDDDDDDGEEEEETEVEAKRLFQEGEDNAKPSSKSPAEFAVPEIDDYMSNIDLGAVVPAKYSPKKTDDANNMTGNRNGNAPRYSMNGNLEGEAKNLGPKTGPASKKAPATAPAESKKRKQNLFQTATKKRRRSGGSTASVQAYTLTQHFSSVKKDKSTDPPLEEDAGGTVANGMIEIRVRGKQVSFKEGDVWLPHGRELRDKGFAFTLGQIRTEDMYYVADIAAAWMRVEHAFLGPEEAASVKACIGSEWVLVKKHELLPRRIKLKELSSRMTSNLPNEAMPLCYEKGEKMAHAFYYECENIPRSPPPQNMRPCALDLFAGAGGTSRGLIDANIDVKYKVEMNQTATNTLQINFPDSLVFCEDIAKFLEDCKTGRVSIYPGRGEIIYIHGSPPCQGFSAVNTSGGANDRQNNECTNTFLKVIEHFQPAFVSMENVPGMTQDKNIQYLLHLVGGLLKMGYQVRTTVVKAIHFGDPQDRARVIVMASKRGYRLPSLKPTHGEGKLKIVTVGDVLRDLEDVDPVPGSMGLVDIPHKGHVWDHIKDGTELREKNDNDHVLNAELPANTVRKQNQIRHYKHSRYLTVRERARLQSFPDSHRFAGTKKEMFDQIGNAVPVGLATAIGRAIMESYQLGRCNMPPH